MKATSLLALFIFINSSFTQLTAQDTNPTFEKECRLVGGGGIGNSFGNATPGPNMWLQMSYRLSRNFSVATEFEYIFYNRPSFYQFPQRSPDDQEFFDNYISFLIKYHLPIRSKLQFNVVSGWSYHIQQLSYSYFEGNTNTGLYLNETRYHYSNFAIPFIAEVNYPLNKIFQVGVRGKYNLNAAGDENTYSASAGISIKL